MPYDGERDMASRENYSDPFGEKCVALVREAREEFMNEGSLLERVSGFLGEVVNRSARSFQRYVGDHVVNYLRK